MTNRPPGEVVTEALQFLSGRLGTEFVHICNQNSLRVGFASSRPRGQSALCLGIFMPSPSQCFLGSPSKHSVETPGATCKVLCLPPLLTQLLAQLFDQHTPQDQRRYLSPLTGRERVPLNGCRTPCFTPEKPSIRSMGRRGEVSAVPGPTQPSVSPGKVAWVHDVKVFF